MSEKLHYDITPLTDIMTKLRSEQGCPWDREQNHETIKPYLIEETYEVLEAIEEKDMHKLCEELGDLLLQVVFHAEIARENASFTLQEVIDGVCEKMIRRHPHVFGQAKVKDAQHVLENWEKIKQKEKGIDGTESVLAGIPRGLPALMQAYKVQAKAAKVGFDWDKLDDTMAKVCEEVDEFLEACAGQDRARMADELGDLLFSIVNVARQLKLEPETSLLGTVSKFTRRFQYIEQRARASGKSVEDMTLAEMDGLWEEAKRTAK